MTASRKKLLFVSDSFPYPLDRGMRIRIHNLLEACAADFDVILVVPRPRGFDPEKMPLRLSKVVLVDMEATGKFDWVSFVQALRLRIGLSFGKRVRERMRFLQALRPLDIASFDLIWAERPHIACLFRDYGGRTIVDFDDLEHRKLVAIMGMQPLSFSFVNHLYRYLIYRRAELHVFRKFLATMVCSDEDRDYLQQHGMRNVHVVPNGAAVPKTLGPRRARQSGQALRVVFLGNVEGAPNRDAIEFFADSILPHVGSVVESFDVIGPNAAPDLINKFAGRVRFRGFVTDLSVALSQYDAMVVPIRFGSGTKLKVLDAMAYGLPLVTTAFGAEGLNLVDDTSALIVSTAQSMVRALERLASEPDLGPRLAAEAYAVACRQFLWGDLQADLAENLHRLAARATSS